MFVTRLSCLCGNENTEKKEHAEITRVINRLTQNTEIHTKQDNERFYAFAFENLGNMINVCRRLERIGYTGKSDAYVGYDKRSYLFLSDLEPCAYLPLDEFSFIYEYGTSENEEVMRSYVSEYAKEICKSHAVEELAKF